VILDIHKELSNNIIYNKPYSIKKSKELFENGFKYQEYLKTLNLGDEEKINIYLNYMLESIFALRYLKKEMQKIPNFEKKVVSKTILSVHLSAIKKSKEINLKDLVATTEFGFYYGWLSPVDYENKDFFNAGKNVIEKLKSIRLPKNFSETKDKISKIARLYEWRKMLWMRLYLLLPKDTKKVYKVLRYFIEKHKNKN